MSLLIESIQGARISISNAKNHTNSYSFSGYSETWKKIWECIRPILIALSCGAWKPDPFIQVSCQGKTVYILPDQIKESYAKLHVALPSGSITEETLAQWVLSVGSILPVSTTQNEQSSTLPSTSSASDSTSTPQPSQELQSVSPKIPEIESPATPISTVVSPSLSSDSASSGTSTPQSGQKPSSQPAQKPLTDELARSIADKFLNGPNKKNPQASLRDEAFQEDIGNFKTKHPQVQNHILAALVTDGVIPTRLKSFYDADPQKKKSHYAGIPKAFNLYIDRLSPARFEAFQAQFGIIDLGKCSDEQAESMATFFKTGQLDLETVPASFSLSSVSSSPSSSSSAVSSSSESSQSIVAASTSSPSISPPIVSSETPLPSPTHLIVGFQEKDMPEDPGVDDAGPEALFSSTFETFEKYTPLQQIEFIYILTWHVINKKQPLSLCVSDDIIVAYIRLIRTQFTSPSPHVSEANLICLEKENAFTTSKYISGIHPILEEILKEHNPSALKT